MLSFSGGKDSTATLLWLIKEKKIPKEKLHVVFCDTGNEKVETYKQIKYLQRLIKSWGYWKRNDVGIKVISGQETFLSLANRRSRFPSMGVRFCTEQLKIIPQINWIQNTFPNYQNDVISITGIRWEESLKRAERKEWEFDSKCKGLVMWNPIISWTAKQVFNIHHKYGVIPHPAYRIGFSRVGCFPCINSSKGEIKLINKHYPWRIAEIDHWEKITGSTYFAPIKEGKINKIHDVVKWAQKGQGEDMFPDEPNCAYAGMGVCE